MCFLLVSITFSVLQCYDLTNTAEIINSYTFIRNFQRTLKGEASETKGVEERARQNDRKDQ